MSDLVEWSVMECNRLYGRQVKPRGAQCPECKTDGWTTHWGIDPHFASEFNPGEYLDFTCYTCGYYDGPHQS